MKKQLILTGFLFSSVLTPLMASAETTTMSSTAVSTPKAKTENKSQKITIQKVIVDKNATLPAGSEVKQLKGVNGATFKVYDVTHVLNDFLKPYLDKANAYEKIKEKLQEHTRESTEETTETTTSSSGTSTQPSKTPRTEESTSTSNSATSSTGTNNSTTSSSSTMNSTSESNEKKKQKDKQKEIEELQKMLESLRSDNLTSDQLTEKITALAKKQDVKKLKVFAQGTTQNSNGKDGIVEFTVPIEETSYQAFYVVNESVQDNAATTSEPFVLITPVMDSLTGIPMEQVFVYPKGQVIPKPTPQGKLPETYVKLPNTGIQGDWLSDIFNLLFKG